MCLIRAQLPRKSAKQEKEEPTEQPDQGTAFKEKHAKQEQEEATEQSDGKGPAPVKMEANAKPEFSDIDFLNSLFGGMRGTEGVILENFRALAYGLGKTILEKFNGPSNYFWWWRPMMEARSLGQSWARSFATAIRQGWTSP